MLNMLKILKRKKPGYVLGVFLAAMIFLSIPLAFVLAAPLVSISLAPLESIVVASSTQQFSVIAYDSLGLISTSSQSAFVWVSSDITVGTINALGLFSAVAPGTVIIRATVDGLIGLTTITVIPAASVLVDEALPDGALIRADNDVDIYIIKYVTLVDSTSSPQTGLGQVVKKFKRLILDQSILNSYQHLKWSDVLSVGKNVFDSFIVSDLIRVTGDDKVYKVYPSGDASGRRWAKVGEAFIRLDVGKKRWIKTSEVFDRLGFDRDSVYEVNNVEENSYSTGVEIY